MGDLLAFDLAFIHFRKCRDYARISLGLLEAFSALSANSRIGLDIIRISLGLSKARRRRAAAPRRISLGLLEASGALYVYTWYFDSIRRTRRTLRIGLGFTRIILGPTF